MIYLAAFNRRILFLSTLLCLCYFLINFYFTNNQLINLTIFGNYTFHYKIELISELFFGLGNAIGYLNLGFLIIISVLTGVNLALILDRLVFWGKFSEINLMVGGGSFLGTFTAGCVSCGLPLLGVLGLSGSLANLPFHGVEVSIFSVFLLFSSFIILVRNQTQSCKI